MTDPKGADMFGADVVEDLALPALTPIELLALSDWFDSRRRPRFLFDEVL